MKLGAQVTIRLGPEMADRLREVAFQKGEGYTVLMRRWIEDRLRAETIPPPQPTPQIQVAGHTTPATIQVSGPGSTRMLP